MAPTSEPQGLASDSAEQHGNRLRLRRLGIETQQEAVVYMRQDCHVCRSEGLTAHARVRIDCGDRSIIATLNHVTTDLLSPGEASLSEVAWRRLAAVEGGEIAVSHPDPVESMSSVRAKVYGNRLRGDQLKTIVEDIVAGRYSDIYLASFLTACAARPLDIKEMIALTKAMVDAGESLKWQQSIVADKHCIGGLPGNRTTPIVVAIAAANGLTMPKTSSRAITSPAGTADAMETLAPVDLGLAQMQRVVEREGACIVWGGSVSLSPADDLLIRIERGLDLDSGGQLVASVLSKKAAAGSTHVVIDMPVGETAKVRSAQAAMDLSRDLTAVADALGLALTVVETDGAQPVGRGIGPALEALDVLSVLGNEAAAPHDLQQRSIALAGRLLEIAGSAKAGDGAATAAATLTDGRARKKFDAICEAQGGLREPPVAGHKHAVTAERSGRIEQIDNRILARIAKLAGAPAAKASGLEMAVRLGDAVGKGDPLFVVHAEAPGELDYAMGYLGSGVVPVRIGDEA